MELTICFAFAVVFALLGAKLRLYAAWILFLSGAFAVYLSIWLMPLAGKYLTSLPEQAAPYRGAGAFLILGILIFSFLSASAFKINPKEEIVFPAVFDRYAALVLGGLFGMLVFSFLISAVAFSPFSGQTKLFEQKSLETFASNSLMRISGGVDSFAWGKSDRTEKRKAYIASCFHKTEDEKLDEEIERSAAESPANPSVPEKKNSAVPDSPAAPAGSEKKNVPAETSAATSNGGVNVFTRSIRRARAVSEEPAKRHEAEAPK